MSLIYIGIVVLLHIYAKLGAKPVDPKTATPTPEETVQNEQA